MRAFIAVAPVPVKLENVATEPHALVCFHRHTPSGPARYAASRADDSSAAISEKRARFKKSTALRSSACLKATPS